MFWKCHNHSRNKDQYVVSLAFITFNSFSSLCYPVMLLFSAVLEHISQFKSNNSQCVALLMVMGPGEQIAMADTVLY